MTFKEFLRQPGWSGKRMAKETGLSEPMVSRIANGRHLPNVAAAVLIGEATGGVFGVDYWAAKAAKKINVKLPEKAA